MRDFYSILHRVPRCSVYFWRVGLLLWPLLFISTANATAERAAAYQRLEASLPLYQDALVHPWPHLPSVETLGFGSRHSAVALLRQRLCATHDLSATACGAAADQTDFSEEVEQAVVFFQERHGLAPDGLVGEATRQALNVSPGQRVRQIQLNLRRYAQLLDLAEPAYIWVNVPDHRLRLMKNQQAILVSRIVVGRLSRQTPEISSRVTRIILNPHWTVPPGIARRDVIPQILKDRTYLQQHRMKVFAVNQPDHALDPNAVDWLAVARNPSRYRLRQDPGPHNALGQIKFEFSNPHSVYLHDTPAKHLFEAEKRLFSSGCVRMEDPFDLLDALAQFYPSLQRAEVQIEAALESGKTVAIRLQEPVAIHVTYITAWVDKAGVLHFWDDVYDRDGNSSPEV